MAAKGWLLLLVARSLARVFDVERVEALLEK